MQNDLFRQVVEAVVDDIEEASKAAQDAKAQGLDYIGFGRYGKNGKVTHTSKGGKLTPVAKRQQSTPQNRFNTAADKSDAEDKAWAKEKGSKEVNRIKKLYGEPKPEQPANKSVRKGIPKEAHKTPEVHAKVAAAMSKFVNLPGGTFQWVDSKKGGHYKYDDTKDGKDYYAVVTPLDNDKYEINHWNPKTKFGRRKLPTKIVKGLKGVKKGLEPAVDTYYKPNDQKNEPAWVRGTGGKYYSSIDGAQWDGPGAGRGATPYSSAPYDPYAG